MEPHKKNGFAIRTWSDVGVIVLLVTFILSGLIWGMKLEGRYDTLDSSVDKIARQVGNGILPRAEERIKALEAEKNRLESQLERIESRMAAHGVNGTKH